MTGRAAVGHRGPRMRLRAAGSGAEQFPLLRDEPSFRAMTKVPSPYRSLPPERRTELVTQAIKASRESRMIFMHRLASRPGGLRAVTLQ